MQKYATDGFRLIALFFKNMNCTNLSFTTSVECLHGAMGLKSVPKISTTPVKLQKCSHILESLCVNILSLIVLVVLACVDNRNKKWSYIAP